MLRDITLRKEAEQQREALAQTEKLRALGQMAVGIAHDLNQSLMLVASYSDLARTALDREPRIEMSSGTCSPPPRRRRWMGGKP